MSSSRRTHSQVQCSPNCLWLPYLRTFSPLDPKILEHKEYAPGVGLITEDVVKGAHETSHLVRIERA